MTALVVALCTATTVWAATPSDDVTIRACYAKKEKRERALAWNQTGPAGSAGAKGATGPKGPKGEPGTPSVAYATQGFEILDADDLLLGELTLPAGKYLLFGTGTASNGGDDAGEVSCIAGSSAGDILPEVTETVPAGGSAMFTAQFGIELPAAAVVSVFCVDPAATGMLGLGMALTAVPVGTIVHQ